MPTIKYFSAAFAGPTQTKGPRLQVKNRDTGKIQEWPWCTYIPNANDEQAQVRHHYHSPLLKLEMLWYDGALNCQFFRTIEE